MPLTNVALSLGSNIGDREGNLQAAREGIESAGIIVTARSPLYETEPQDVENQPWFLNQVVLCATTSAPVQLLGQLQAIEFELGRDRGPDVLRRGPRSIDIDILLYGDLAIETPSLVIPHPRLLERRFALEPLLDIFPTALHPVTHRPLRDYLVNVSGQKLRKLG